MCVSARGIRPFDIDDGSNFSASSVMYNENSTESRNYNFLHIINDRSSIVVDIKAEGLPVLLLFTPLPGVITEGSLEVGIEESELQIRDPLKRTVLRRKTVYSLINSKSFVSMWFSWDDKFQVKLMEHHTRLL